MGNRKIKLSKSNSNSSTINFDTSKYVKHNKRGLNMNQEHNEDTSVRETARVAGIIRKFLNTGIVPVIEKLSSVQLENLKSRVELQGQQHVNALELKSQERVDDSIQVLKDAFVGFCSSRMGAVVADAFVSSARGEVNLQEDIRRRKLETRQSDHEVEVYESVRRLNALKREEEIAELHHKLEVLRLESQVSEASTKSNPLEARIAKIAADLNLDLSPEVISEFVRSNPLDPEN